MMLGSIRALQNKPHHATIPEGMLDYFNQDAPAGYSYQIIDDDGKISALQPKPNNPAQETTFRGLRPILSEEQRKTLGPLADNPTEIIRYLENSLEPLQLDIAGAEAVFDLKTIPAARLIRTADDNEYGARGRLFIKSSARYYNTHFEYKDIILPIVLKQIPSKSASIRRFESTETPLHITVNVDLNSRTLTYSYHFDNTGEPIARKVLCAAQIYYGLGIGEATLQGIGGVRPDDSEAGKRNGEKLVKLWTMIVELEEALDVSFDASARVTENTVSIISRLHRGILENHAVGLGYKPESITLENELSELPVDGRQFVSLFPKQVELNVLNTTLHIDAVVGLKGFSFGKPIRENDNLIKYPLIFSDNYQCSILYLANGETDDSTDNISKLIEILNEPLPNSRHY